MGRIRGGHSWGTLDNTCHVPFSLILQCYKSLYLISENAFAWVWKVSFENVSVLCTERNERALNLITVQWRNMLHVSQVIFLLSSQILLIWQYYNYTLVPPESPPEPCPSMIGRWWSSPRRCCCSAPSGDACHVSRVTCHVSGLLSRCYQQCSIIIFAIL